MYRKPVIRAFAAQTMPAIVLGLLLIGLIGCSTTHQGPPLDRTIEHRWSKDIEVMFDTLPEKHKNLFFKLSEEEYRRRLVELNERAPGLSAPEFETELRRVLADVGDAHTGISFAHDSLFPLHFQDFEEGIFVVAAVPGYEEYIGARLERVEAMSVEAYNDAAVEITPHDNTSQLKMWTPVYLTIPTVLAGLGISDSVSEVTYTFARSDGSSREVSLPAVERQDVSQLVSIRDRVQERGVSLPVSRQNTGALYRYEHLADHQAVYVQYNSCREDESYPMKDFVEDAFADVRAEDAEVMIVDLRRNSGGDSRVFHPFIQAAEEWGEGADSGGGADGSTTGGRELYVLIGRNTFSSAVLNAIELKQKAGAVFVGEPSGGRPNHYGEIKALELSDLGRTLTYSTKYFNTYKAGDPSSLMPDIEAPHSYEAYIEGRDRALEVALNAAGAAGAR